MYKIDLTSASFPVQADAEVREPTVGGALRAQAALTLHTGALVECDMAGPAWPALDLERAIWPMRIGW